MTDRCPYCGQERREKERRTGPRGGGRRAADVYSPMEAALSVGLTYNQVLVDIRCGELKAVKVVRGKRTRFIIPKRELDIWAARLGLSVANASNGSLETSKRAS